MCTRSLSVMLLALLICSFTAASRGEAADEQREQHHAQGPGTHKRAST